MAPVDGTYLFGATLLYKVNSSTSARMRGRLALNGATEIRVFGEISATHVSLATAIWLQTMVPLTAGDTVELQGYLPGRRRLLRRRPHVLLGLQGRLGSRPFKTYIETAPAPAAVVIGLLQRRILEESYG